MDLDASEDERQRRLEERSQFCLGSTVQTKFGTNLPPRADCIVVFSHAGPLMSAALRPATGSGNGFGSDSKNC